MKKPLLVSLLSFSVVLSALAGSALRPPIGDAADHTAAVWTSDIRITLHGEPFQPEQPPVLVNGSTLAPLREIAEALGAAVEWDERKQQVSLSSEAAQVSLTIGSLDASKNGQPIRLETAPQLINGVTMVPLRFIGESFDTLVTWDEPSRTVSIESLQTLPTIADRSHLQTLLNEAAANGGSSGAWVTVDSVAASVPAAGRTSAPMANEAAVSDGAVAKKAEAGTDYSVTNTQTEGVDEADVVKTDGEYVYQVNSGRIVITKAVPASAMQVASILTFSDSSFRATELYVDSRYLVVIGAMQRPVKSSTIAPEPDTTNRSSAVAKRMILPYPMGTEVVKAIVYDITDKTAPKQVREVELDGSYVSSRKIGPALYLIANKQAIQPIYAAYRSGEEEAGQPLPLYRDSAAFEEPQTIDYSDIRYFPGFREPTYMLIGAVHLDKHEQAMDVSAYLGAGHNVYASDTHLYTAITRYEAVHTEPAVEPAMEQEAVPPQIAPSAGVATPSLLPEARSIIVPPAPRHDNKTVVYKFRLEQGVVKYVTQGEVPGTILNQFSMDEHNSLLRIATTTGEMWRTDEFTSKNNLYTLDEALRPLGKLEGIAPGERIYSVRFMGNRAYMVTFRNTDPLFAIDLTNPAAPSILGALKIPGYSDYLHPYDEHHLIGFGKETVEIPVKGNPRSPDQTIAYYQGVKLSLFDVTDVSHPVEKFKEVIGDRGTESDILHNHKALLFSKERDLLAFPITVMEVPNKPAGGQQAATAYGQFTFQGAYVYGLDLNTGFQLKTRITHLSDDELRKAGNQWYHSDRSIERLLYIGDSLYTLSQGAIQTHDLAGFSKQGELDIPKR